MRVTSVFSIVVTLFFGATGLAQSRTPPPLSNVAVVQIKPDMVGEYEALQKEYTAAWKARGRPARNVWQVVRGNTNEYHIVTPLQKYADLDESRPVMDEPAWTRWVSRIRKCTDNRRVITQEYQRHLSIPPRPGHTRQLLRLSIQEVDGARLTDYVEYREEVLLPAYKRAGFDGLYVARVRYGADRQTWVVGLAADSWADLDQPLPVRRSLSEQAAQDQSNRFNAMLDRTEWLVLRHRPDLSHNPN